MRHWKRTDFTDRYGRHWFDPDKWFITASMDVTQSVPAFESSPPDRTGSIDLTQEQFTLVCGPAAGPITGDIDVTQELPTLSADGTTPEAAPSTEITLNQLNPHLLMRTGHTMAFVGEAMNFRLQEEIMADMELLQREPTLFIIGDSKYVYATFTGRTPSMLMYAASNMEIEAERPALSMVGVVGVLGDIICRSSRCTLQMTGGPQSAIGLVMEPPELEITGIGEIMARLDVVARRMDLYAEGSQDIICRIDVRTRAMTIELDGTVHPVGTIDLRSLRPLLTMTAIQGVEADLEARMLLMKMVASANIDGPNSINLEAEEPSIVLGVDDETCDLADTLVYGG